MNISSVFASGLHAVLSFRHDELKPKEDALIKKMGSIHWCNLLSFLAGEAGSLISCELKKNPSLPSFIQELIRKDEQLVSSVIKEMLFDLFLKKKEIDSDANALFYFKRVLSDILLPVQERFCELLQEKPDTLDVASKKQTLFLTAAQNLMTEFEMDDPGCIPLYVGGHQVHKALKEALPKLLEQLFEEIFYVSGLKEETLLFEAVFKYRKQQDSLLTPLLCGLSLRGFAEEDSYDATGTLTHAKFVNECLEVAATFLADLILGSLQRSTHQCAELFHKVVQRGLFDAEHTQFLKGLFDAFFTQESAHHPFLRPLLKNYLKKFLTILLSRFLLLDEGRRRDFLDTLFERFSKDISYFEHLDDKDKRREGLFRAFQGLIIGTLSTLLEQDQEHLLPAPHVKKKCFFDLIGKELLPELALEKYEEMILWHRQQKTSLEKIEHSYESKIPIELAKAIKSFARHSFPTILKENKEMISSYFRQSMEEFFEGKEEPRRYMQEQGEAVTFFFMSLLDYVLTHRDPLVESCFGALSSYLYSSCLYLLSILGEKSSTLDMPKFALKIIKHIADHVEAINNLALSKGVAACHKLPSEEVLAHFEKVNLLHTGQRVDEMSGFYQPFAKEFLSALRINKAVDLPLPESISLRVFPLLQETILPTVFKNLFEKALKPETVHRAILALLRPIDEAAEKIREKSFASSPPIPMHQKDIARLNKECGALVHQILKMLTTILIDEKNLREIGGEKLGFIVRQLLREWSLASVINSVIVSGLPLLFNGTWEGSGKEMIFRYRFTQIEEDEAMSVVRNSCLDQLEKDAVSALARRIRAKTWGGIQEFMGSSYETLFSTIDRFLALFLPEKILEAKNALDQLCSFYFTTFIAPIMSTLLQPIAYCVCRLLDVLYFEPKARSIIKTLEMPSVKNLLFHLTGPTMELLQDEN